MQQWKKVSVHNMFDALHEEGNDEVEQNIESETEKATQATNKEVVFW